MKINLWLTKHVTWMGSFRRRTDFYGNICWKASSKDSAMRACHYNRSYSKRIAMGKWRNWLHIVFNGRRFILVSHLLRTTHALHNRSNWISSSKINLILYSLYVDVWGVDVWEFCNVWVFWKYVYLYLLCFLLFHLRVFTLIYY